MLKLTPLSSVDIIRLNDDSLENKKMSNQPDVYASPMIRVSNGPSEDLMDFYSTSYSTTHNYKSAGARPVRSGPSSQDLIATSNKLYLAGDEHGVVGKSKWKRDETGYTHNVAIHIDYDPKVDESGATRG